MQYVSRGITKSLESYFKFFVDNVYFENGIFRISKILPDWRL